MDEAQEPLVTICCITYNHEKYIRDAIESFLMQETDFPFEIIIHDDASVDMTANIIREYERKYPGLIRPIYQTENQYSKGIKPSTFVFKQSKGKYIALCEGDDYWIDPLKLQKQVNYMETNPNCTFSFHNASLVNDTKGLIKKSMVPYSHENKKLYSNQNRKYDSGELQLLGFIPTASFVFPKKVVENLPDLFYGSPAGDIALKLIATSYGYAYYINEIMSVYRINLNDSMTDLWKKEGIDKYIARIEAFITFLDAFNKWTNDRYLYEIDESKKFFEFRLELAKKNKNIFKIKRCNDYFKKLSTIDKIRYYIKLRYPKVIQLLNGILPSKIKDRLF